MEKQRMTVLNMTNTASFYGEKTNDNLKSGKHQNFYWRDAA